LVYKNYLESKNRVNNIKYSHLKSRLKQQVILTDTIINKRIAKNKYFPKYIYNALIDSIFPFWYGTKWGMNGTSQLPRKGKIACGYFVTTTLCDLGLKIDRIKLAQCSSEKMINAICADSAILRMYNDRNWISKLKVRPYSLFIVGLDTHVGFLFYKNNSFYFVHSTSRFPNGVRIEKAIESQTLLKSKCKIVGDIAYSYLPK
jgi:hypothetical protein